MLFVSHQLSAVQRLCDAVVLDRGRAGAPGRTAADVVAAYLRSGRRRRSAGRRSSHPTTSGRAPASGRARSAASPGDGDGGPWTPCHLGQPFRVNEVFDVREEIDEAIFEFGISSSGGDRMATAQNSDRERPPLRLGARRQEVSATSRDAAAREVTMTSESTDRNGTTLDYVTTAWASAR